MMISAPHGGGTGLSLLPRRRGAYTRAMPGSALSPTVADDLAREIWADGHTTVPVLSAYTGEEMYRLPQSSAASVERAATASRVAQREWWEAGWAPRRATLLRAHGILLERRDELMDAIQTETGKTRGQAFEEIFGGVAATRYAALAAKSTLRTRRRRAGIPLALTTKVSYSPKGLVGVITPWNYPVALALMDVVPALAAGNAVIQKVDDQAAVSVLAARRAFIDAGLDPALWTVVTGPGSEIGAAMTDAVDYLCFTGSTQTGRTVAERAGKRLIGASMELGGKNPVIVLDDVDPKTAAADAAYACFTAAGQLCVSAERIYVERGVADEFTAAFVERTRSLRLGATFDFSADIGSLATAAQLERVLSHIADAVARGARVLAGGIARPDLGPTFVEPTILDRVTDDMACAREETFGPVVALSIVENETDAIERANDSEYGLNASVLSGSRRRAVRVAEQLRAGGVNINEGFRATLSSLDAPMGGHRASGIGRRNGREGLLRFAESTTISRATGLIQLPRSGAEFEPLVEPMVAMERVFSAIRRR